MPSSLYLPKIVRRRSKLHGWGVFAAEPINKNKIIIDYAGELISNKVSDKREDAYLNQGCIWVFRVNRDWSRDANVGGNDARFINHSCVPNCYSAVDAKTKTILDPRRQAHRARRRADLRLQHRGRQDHPMSLQARLQDQALSRRPRAAALASAACSALAIGLAAQDR